MFGDPIDTQTGNFDYTVVDLSLPTSAGPLVFQRTYASQAANVYTTTLGYGWTQNQDTHLILPSSPGGQPNIALFKAHSASQYEFFNNGDGTYSPYPGVLATLISTTVPSTTYTITGADQAVYTFDSTGNLTKWTDPQGHSLVYTYTTVLLPGTGISTTAIAYNYDPLYRLTNANYSTGSVYTYTYDAVGNRLSDAAPTGVTTYTYDIANRLGTINGTINYTWDNNGNLVGNGQGSTYTYDSANRLIALSTSIYTFGYNGQGDRVVQLANGTPITYMLDLAGGLTQVLAETAATTTTTYLYGLARVAQQKGSATDYFLLDALGSVRGLADANGNVTLAKSYDPFGQTISSSGSGSSNYDFTGEYKDGSALFFLRSCYYTSRRGRFLQKDSWTGDYASPLSLNAWVYSLSNPVNYTDPSGNCSGILDFLFGIVGLSSCPIGTDNRPTGFDPVPTDNRPTGFDPVPTESQVYKSNSDGSEQPVLPGFEKYFPKSGPARSAADNFAVGSTCIAGQFSIIQPRRLSGQFEKGPSTPADFTSDRLYGLHDRLQRSSWICRQFIPAASGD